MGQLDIAGHTDERELRRFSRALLHDVQALERMCDTGMIEQGVRRIGAEQEMFLTDAAGRPTPIAMRVLERLNDARYTTELARFNMEYNLSPALPRGRCFQELEHKLRAVVARAREAARDEGGDVLLAGILPTIARTDLSLDNLTPLPRYRELNRIMTEMSGGQFRTQISGVDELQITQASVMLEACNTSFQIHYQVGAAEFARLYNLSQLVTAPVLAAAANAPLLLGRRLWQETRIALFEQSIDVRSEPERQRGSRRRVSFGDKWVDESVVELFRDSIARFRVLIAADVGPLATELLDRGEIPPLRALCLYNSTVYRWNRPCFGVTDGVAHLRIENRALPAGPTIVDEVANAAFYFGLMAEAADAYGDVRAVVPFASAKMNFLAAARFGIDATFRWSDGRTVRARDLILDTLLPEARRGLARLHIAAEDIDRYLGVIEARVSSGQTGAAWQLRTFERLAGIRQAGARLQALTQAMAERQRTESPVHEWSLPEKTTAPDRREAYRTVGQVMTTDLFTVHPEDLVDVAANVMNWKHLRHVPVEDEAGTLVGLVSHRALLRMMAQGAGDRDAEPVAVREIMRPSPITATPAMPVLDAIALMRDNRVGSLPVVQDGRLVGIVTERDFIDLAAGLLDDFLAGPSADGGGGA